MHNKEDVILAFALCLEGLQTRHVCQENQKITGLCQHEDSWG